MKFKHIEINKKDKRILDVEYEDGRRDRIGYPSQAKALNAKRAMDHLVARKALPTFREFFEGPWRTWHRSFELAADSCPQYDRMAERTMPIIGNVRLDLISEDVLLDLADALRARGVWETTVGNTLRTLSAVIGVACDWRYIESNPMDGISICVIGRRPDEPPKPKHASTHDVDDETPSSDAAA